MDHPAPPLGDSSAGAAKLRNRTIVSVVIAILGLGLVIWSGINAFQNVARSRAPAMALRFDAEDPIALAAVADRNFLASPTDRRTRATSARMAYRALQGSLLNPVGVRLAAMRFEQAPSRMLAALDAAQRLTRHDVTTQLQLIEANVEEGHVSGALLGYDRILRRKASMSETLFPALAGAARDANVAPELKKKIAEGVPWSGFFIDWALANDVELDTLLPVINVAPSNATGLSEGRKQSIVRRLVELNKYDAADAAYRLYRGPIEQSASGRASDFKRIGQFAPFDWEIQNGSMVDGAIDPRAGMFHFSLLGEGQELILRRLVRAPARRYRLEVTGALSEPSRVKALARATCAQGGAVLGSASLNSGARNAAADVAVPESCKFVWLTLEASSGSDQAIEGHLSRLRLTPGSGR